MRLMTWLPDFASPSRDSLIEAAVVLGRLAGMPLSDVQRLPADSVSEWLEAAARVNARLAGEQRYG
jgi:hypothetical protein